MGVLSTELGSTSPRALERLYPAPPDFKNSIEPQGELVSTPPPATNNPAQLAAQIMASVFSAAETLIEDASMAAYPFLADPVVKQLFDLAVSVIGNKFLQQISAMAINGVIAIEVIAEDATFMSARASLADAMAKGDPNAISQARSAVDKAFAALVTWDGTAKPTGG